MHVPDEAAPVSNGPGAVAARPGGPAGVAVVVPVRALEGAKSRLGAQLDAEERQALVLALFERVLEAARGTAGVGRVIVVSPDGEVLRRAARAGALPLRQQSGDLNAGLVQAADLAAAMGVAAVLVLPADLPAINPAEVRRLVESASASARPGRPLVALVPDRHGGGTNALLVSPPRAIPFRFGEGSRSLHATEARAAGAVYLELDGPLSLDIDTPDDLLLADLAGLDHGDGR